MRRRYGVLDRVEDEAGELQPFGGCDHPGEFDGFAGRLDAGALAAAVALDQDAEGPTGDGCRLRQPGNGDRIVGGDGDGSGRGKRAEARELLVAEDVVGDQDVVQPAIGHHLGLAELLAGDAACAGALLHRRDLRVLVRLDMRPRRDAGGVAHRLHARDVVLDDVEIDHQAGGAVVARDRLLQLFHRGEFHRHGLLI